MALNVLKGEATVVEFVSRFGVHPKMVHAWKKALPDGDSGVFERSGKKAPGIDGEQLKELHARIGELAVANDFLSRQLKPRSVT